MLTTAALALLFVSPNSGAWALSAKERVYLGSRTYIAKAFLCEVGTGNRAYLPKAVEDSRQRMIRAGYSAADAKQEINSLLEKLKANRTKVGIVPVDDSLCRKMLAAYGDP